MMDKHTTTLLERLVFAVEKHNQKLEDIQLAIMRLETVLEDD